MNNLTIREYMALIGRKGGLATKKSHKKGYFKELGRLGGMATQYGRTVDKSIDKRKPLARIRQRSKA